MGRNARLRRLPIVLLGAAGAVLIVGAMLVVVLAQRWMFTMTAQPPAVGTPVLAPEQSKAQRAFLSGELTETQAEAAQYLAAQPTAYWLTPEQDPPGTVGRTVSSLTSQARDADVAVALVVYGLPERDCGHHSAGGLQPSDYMAWTREIGHALEAAPDVRKIIVLEPDSLALAPQCGNLEERVPQLAGAVAQLAGPATWIYLDGGHSGWLPAEQMADLIEAVGVTDQVRGFATNVSNYRSTHDEFLYARAVSEELGGIHAVIDTSRNGAATAGADWCNPPSQRVGEPSGTYGDDVVDMNLWIKPPGESDGPCHGGPPAGAWWPDHAVSLLGDHG